MNLNLEFKDEPRVNHTLSVYVSVKERLETIAKENGTKVPNLMRHMINNFIANYEKESKNG